MMNDSIPETGTESGDTSLTERLSSDECTIHSHGDNWGILEKQPGESYQGTSLPTRGSVILATDETIQATLAQGKYDCWI